MKDGCYNSEEYENGTCSLSLRAYAEALEFLATNPNLTEILTFHPSSILQREVRHLLDKLDDGILTLDESNELDRIGELEHMMIALKARAATINLMRGEPCPNPD